MQPTFDFFAGAYQAESDDPFGATVRPRSRSQITCKVCERRDWPSQEYPLLCVHCGRDIEQTRMHVHNTLVQYEGHVEAADEALTASIPGDPDDALSVRWGAFMEAVQKRDAAADLAERKARNGMQGPLADLIRLWCAYTDAKGVYEARCRWAAAAELAMSVAEREAEV